MRRARQWRLVCAAGLLATASRAQTLPPTLPAPAPVVAPTAGSRLDSLKNPLPPTFVADTARHVVVVNTTEPTAEVTRRTGLLIGAVIVVLTLTTLLLYNVRSR